MAGHKSAPVIVALDYASANEALAFVDRVSPQSCQLKIGKELFTREGPELVKNVVERGFRVFLDLKFHDIPNTVARACAAAADLGVWMVNVHASGGAVMMETARKELEQFGNERPRLIAVTVLTSMNETQLHQVGISGQVDEQVNRLAALTANAGLDGVVCSSLEVAGLRQMMADDFLLVTPGIRPQGAATNDQSRIMTPANAMAAGSDYLVIGRPITQAENPAQVLTEINHSLVDS